MTSLANKTLFLALVLSGLLTIMAWFMGDMGYVSIAQVLLWPSMLLQSKLPHNNLGTHEQPLYEGTPLNLIALFPVNLL